MRRRAHEGIYRKMSKKHLLRYANEFSGQHDMRGKDTVDQLETIAGRMDGRRLRYTSLIAPNGRSSGARSV